jgi:hypothetical protein
MRRVGALFPRRAVGTLSIAVLLTFGVGPLLAPLAAAKVPPTTVNPRAEVIDGVPLVPITASQRADCERLADHLKGERPVPASSRFRYR